jgi:hypothetical protein
MKITLIWLIWKSLNVIASAIVWNLPYVSIPYFIWKFSDSSLGSIIEGRGFILLLLVPFNLTSVAPGLTALHPAL